MWIYVVTLHVESESRSDRIKYINTVHNYYLLDIHKQLPIQAAQIDKAQQRKNYHR